MLHGQFSDTILTEIKAILIEEAQRVFNQLPLGKISFAIC